MAPGLARLRARLRDSGRAFLRDVAEPQPSARAAVVRRHLDGGVGVHGSARRRGIPRWGHHGCRCRGVRADASGDLPLAFWGGARDRFTRDRVLVWSCGIRSAATTGATVILMAGGPKAAVYALAALATAAFTVFRPLHSALLPGLCVTPLELTSANVVRGLLDSLSMLLGPLAAALFLAVAGPSAVFALVAGALARVRSVAAATVLRATAAPCPTAAATDRA